MDQIRDMGFFGQGKRKWNQLASPTSQNQTFLVYFCLLQWDCSECGGTFNVMGKGLVSDIAGCSFETQGDPEVVLG